MQLNEYRKPPTPEQLAAAAAFREWDAARWAAHKPSTEPGYGMNRCCLCGDPCTAFTCAHCNAGLKGAGL